MSLELSLAPRHNNQVCGSCGCNIRGQQYCGMQTQGESKTEMGGNPWMACLHLTPDTGDNSPRLLETDRTRDVHLLEKPSHAEKWTFLLETPGKYSITEVTCIQRRQEEIIHGVCLLPSVSSHSINNSSFPRYRWRETTQESLCDSSQKCLLWFANKRHPTAFFKFKALRVGLLCSEEPLLELFLVSWQQQTDPFSRAGDMLLGIVCLLWWTSREASAARWRRNTSWLWPQGPQSLPLHIWKSSETRAQPLVLKTPSLKYPSSSQQLASSYAKTGWERWKSFSRQHTGAQRMVAKMLT